MKFLLLIGALLVLWLPGRAQRPKKDQQQDTSAHIYQPERLEFDISDFSEGYRMINGGKDGLLVMEATNNRAGEGHQWIFYYVDTLLNVVWNRTCTIPFDSYMAGTEYHDGKFYILFNKAKLRQENLMVLEIDIREISILQYDITTVFPIQLTFFEVLGDNLIFAGYTNYRAVLLTFNLREQVPRVIPGFYDNKSDILDIIIDDNMHVFTVIQSELMRNRRNTIVAKTFTASGDLIQSNTIEPGDKKNLIDGASTIFLGGFQYIAGTYSRRSAEYSRGLYLAKFVNGRQQFVKYYDFADLNNFFGYMSDRREKRIKDRITRMKTKGKKPQFSYRLLVHDIVQHGGEYLMIAEVYYPRYSSNSANYMGPSSSGNNGNYARYNPTFMGYRYTHAIVVAFDRNGRIIWDNNFEIDDVETYTLKEYVTVSPHDDRIVLMYLDDNTIRSKIIENDEIMEGKTFNPVKLSFLRDQIKSGTSDEEDLERWYGSTMVACGEQNIQNDLAVGGKFNRRVFYINKIRYAMSTSTN